MATPTDPAQEATLVDTGDREATLGAHEGDAPMPDAPDGARAQPARLRETGTVVGRHVVLHKLGAGAMGVVYAAYDPELDRKVALKLLLPGVDGERGRSRLLREAQALAKLAHPNVVGIHDVGVADEQVWLAMEFVQGQTLGAWLRTRRGWREVLAVMRSAGEGLAAAHAAGLLHRDFKPDNVMVGDDGRVRVMDFGLARTRPEGLLETERPPTRSQPTLGSSLERHITQAGALLGTPSYMAPEQFRDEELTAAADQFAFCVTLWEALYGERPFGGRTVLEIIANVLAGRRRPPARGRAIPSRLRRACERGLSVDPRQRWPSMEALASELRRLGAPRRWWALGLAGGLAAVGLGIAHYAEVGFRCEGAQAQLDGVWDAARAKVVKDAILGTGLAYAPDTWVRVEQRLDEYAQAWVAEHTEACEATSVRQEQSPEVMDLRMECLRARKVALRKTVGVLAEADATRVEKAVELVTGLPGLSRCADVEALRTELPPPEDPQAAAQVAALRERLAQVRVLNQAGAYREADAEADAVVEQAEALDHAPLLAEALLARADGGDNLADYPRAERDARRAYELAAQHGHDEVEVQAALLLLWVVGVREARHELGLQWGTTALALAKRDRFEPEVEATALSFMGRVLAAQGQSSEALTHHQRALVIYEQASGPRHPNVATSVGNLGDVLWDQGKLQEALASYQRALAIYEQAWGPRHPYVATALGSIGGLQGAQGDLDDALAHLQRALTLSEEAFGPAHPSVAGILQNMGVVLKNQGKLEESLAHYQRALAIHGEVLGPRHPDVATVLYNMGIGLKNQGKSEESLTHLQRALAIFEEASGPRHPRVAKTRVAMATILRTQDELEESRAHLQRALAIFEEASGPQHADVAYALVGLAEVALLEHDLDTARAHAERAVVAREAGETSPALLAEAHFLLARTLEPDRSQRSRARMLAERARDAYAELGEGHREDLAEVNAWLAEP